MFLNIITNKIQRIGVLYLKKKRLNGSTYLNGFFSIKISLSNYSTSVSISLFWCKMFVQDLTECVYSVYWRHLSFADYLQQTNAQ